MPDEATRLALLWLIFTQSKQPDPVSFTWLRAADLYRSRRVALGTLPLTCLKTAIASTLPKPCHKLVELDPAWSVVRINEALDVARAGAVTGPWHSNT